MVETAAATATRAAASLVLVALAVSGCRSREAFAAQCRQGKLAACEEACKRGVTDEGGCVAAGRTYAALVDEAPSNRDRAVSLFAMGCRAGELVACVEGAALLDPKGAGARPAPAEELRDRACQLGHAATCMAVIRDSIGEDDKRTNEAVTRWCALGRPAADASACVRERGDKIRALAEVRTRCAGGRDFFACRDLGDRILPLAPARALRAYTDPCAASGLSDEALWEGEATPTALPDAPKGIAACVTHLRDDARERWRAVLDASIVGPDHEAWSVEPPRYEGPIGRSAPLFDATKTPRPKLQPRMTLAPPPAGPRNLLPGEVTPVILERQGALVACYARGLADNPHLQGRIGVTGVVDLSGRVLVVYEHGSDLPDRATVNCVRDVVRDLRFARPASAVAARVDVAVSFAPD